MWETFIYKGFFFFAKNIINKKHLKRGGNIIISEVFQ